MTFAVVSGEGHGRRAAKRQGTAPVPFPVLTLNLPSGKLGEDQGKLREIKGGRESARNSLIDRALSDPTVRQ